MNKKFIVLRQCPPSLARLEGQWCEVESVNLEFVTADDVLTYISFIGTRRFESREDGCSAEVFKPERDTT
jgi:hypothetical protein